MRGAVALVLACAIAGCRHDKPAAIDTAAAASSATAAVPGAGPTCQRTGHWSECTVRIRLDQSGLAPQSGSDKVGSLPSLAPKPLTLTIGSAGIAYYLYPDSMARRAAAATLDTAKYIAQTRPVSMKAETTLIENDNVLVLLFSQNEHQRERVADAITAGPPQP